MAELDHRVLASLDSCTISAILQCYLEDSKEMKSASKGKHRADTVTDSELALQLYEQDLHACSTVLEDRKMAQSMCLAVSADAALIQETVKQEEQAAQDRAMALTMSGHVAPPATTARAAPTSATARDIPTSANPVPTTSSVLGKRSRDFEGPETLSTVERPAKQMKSAPVAESSSWAASRKTTTLRSCIACSNDFAPHDLARVPCNHEYCRECLEHVFRQSLKDETYFPPRCERQEIPLYLVRRYLSADLVKEFEARYEELSTKVRTYCHEKTCSAFIPQRSIAGKLATCPKCKDTTCAMCKAATHSGVCLKDETLRLLDPTGSHRFQQCYQCKRVVELKIGCHHITCPCSAQFCYVCGLKWKTCRCPRWDEQRLLDRGVRVADRRAARPPEPQQAVPVPQAVPRAIPQVIPQAIPQALNQANLRTIPGTENGRATNRAASVAATVQHLRAHHECDHESWQRVRGPHECEECGEMTRHFIKECRQCFLQACTPCTMNRL